MCGWVKTPPCKHPENGLFLQAVTRGISFVGDRKLHGVRVVARVGFGPIVLLNMDGQGRAFPCLFIAGGCKRAFAAADRIGEHFACVVLVFQCAAGLQCHIDGLAGVQLGVGQRDCAEGRILSLRNHRCIGRNRHGVRWVNMRFDLYLAVILGGKGRGAKRRRKCRRKGKGQILFIRFLLFSSAGIRQG